MAIVIPGKIVHVLVTLVVIIASDIYPQQRDRRAISDNDPWLDQLAREYRHKRNQMVNEAIPIFNKRLREAVAKYGDIFADTDDFEPLFKREWRWCTESTANLSKVAPVSELPCSEIARTYAFTSENYDYSLKHGVPIVPPLFSNGMCRNEYPRRASDNSLDNGWRTISVPGSTSARQMVHVCDLKEQEHYRKYESNVGDLEVERKAWQVRKASRARAVAKTQEDRAGLPLIDSTGKLDMGVYECDPANWRVVRMLHEVGLIKKLEQPLESSGGNIRAWCENSAHDIPEVCKWESDKYEPNRAQACREAGKYWKFSIKTFTVKPSMCDEAYDKAYRLAESNGSKFTRFYDPQDQVCKVRFARRKAKAQSTEN